ncbi:MAG TPA: MFS transporter [Candidatus Polarisedimenticolaceae bacterium]|nr:MFS transporter [Candidatus Polarisedimenticolaceae bacterium]
MTEPSIGTARSTWSPLTHRVFRALWIASTASHVSSYMSDVAQGWLMSSLTPSPLVVSLLVTAESLPFFMLGLPAGALADIVDRRRLLMVTQLAMALVMGGLAVATVLGAASPWMMLGFAFALGIATAFNDPTWYAVVPEILPKEELEAGVTVSGVGVNIARTLGPALGGFVVAAFGPGGVFALDALSFFGVVGVILAWRRERSRSLLPAERMLGAIRAGLRFARYSDALRRVLFATFLFMACGGGIMGLMPVLGRETGHGAIGFGSLLGSLGVGAVAGAALLPRVRSRTSFATLVAAGSVTFAGVAFTASMSRTLAVLCPVMLLGGVAWISVLSTLILGAQQAAPPWVRARALAVYLIVFQAGIAGGSALWGFVASRRGLSAAYIGIAAGLLLGAAAAVRLRGIAGAAIDFTPARHWADPVVAGDPSLEGGPVMVQVEYVVDASRTDEFRSIVAELGRSRRRDGAIEWWLFQDTAEPSRFVETWIEETWADHLRSHERVSVAHQAVEQRVRDLTRGGSAITTRHFITPESPRSAAAAVRAVEQRTGC